MKNTIKILLDQTGYSQTEFAEKVGISRQRLYKQLKSKKMKIDETLEYMPKVGFYYLEWIDDNGKKCNLQIRTPESIKNLKVEL